MLNKIFTEFNTQGTLQTAQSYGSGHINDTYLAQTRESNCPDYILQRINPNVFTNPAALMNNVLQVTQHIQKN